MTLFAIGQSLLFIIIAPLVPLTGLSKTEFGLIFGVANIPLIFRRPHVGAPERPLRAQAYIHSSACLAAPSARSWWR